MGKRVFVVDDERVIADTLCAILRKYGHNALAFYDAESALTAAQEKEPEFVISDVVMPGMSGVDLGVQIRGRFPECGVLLFSGQAATVDMLEAARQNGHNFDLLTKPVHPKDLVAKLDGAQRSMPRDPQESSIRQSQEV